MARVQQNYMQPGLPGQPMAPPMAPPMEEEETPTQTERALSQATPGAPPDQVKMQAQQVIAEFGGDDDAAARSVIEASLPQLVGYQPPDRQQRVADGQVGVGAMNALASTQDFLNRVGSYGVAGDRGIQRPNPLRDQAKAFEGQLRTDFDAERRMAETDQRLQMQVDERGRDQSNRERDFALQEDRFSLEQRKTEPQIQGLERAEARAQRLQEVESPETAMVRETLSTAFPDMAEGIKELDGEMLASLEASIRAGQNRLDALAKHREQMAYKQAALAAKGKKGSGSGGGGGGAGGEARSLLVDVIAEEIATNDPTLSPDQVAERARLAAADEVTARSYLRANPERAKRIEAQISDTTTRLEKMSNALDAMSGLERALGEVNGLGGPVDLAKLQDVDGTPTYNGKPIELPGFYNPFTRTGRTMSIGRESAKVGTALGGYTNVILKDRSGAAVTEPEQIRMESELSFGPFATSAKILDALKRQKMMFMDATNRRMASLPDFARQEYLRRQAAIRGEEMPTTNAGRAPATQADSAPPRLPAQPTQQGAGAQQQGMPQTPPPPGPALVNVRNTKTGKIVKNVPLAKAQEVVGRDQSLEIF